jgi:hypothetical protein
VATHLEAHLLAEAGDDVRDGPLVARRVLRVGAHQLDEPSNQALAIDARGEPPSRGAQALRHFVP